MFSWIFFAILSAVFAALVAIFGKIGLSTIDSTLATTVRAFVMSVFLIIVSLVSGKLSGINVIKGKSLIFIILSGIAGALSWLCYFFALKTGKTAGVAARDRLSVVLVLIFSILFLGDKLTWQSAIGGALITLGAILMVIK